VLAALAIGGLALILALLKIGVLWIIIFLLVALAVSGYLGWSAYEDSRCPACGRPFALKLVREKTMGPGKRKKQLVARYRYMAIEEVRESIVDEIYRCKYCGHRSRVTRQVKGHS
jgi:hypothetical protein